MSNVSPALSSTRRTSTGFIHSGSATCNDSQCHKSFQLFPRDLTRVFDTTLIIVKCPLFAPLLALASGILFSRMLGFGRVELLVCLPLFFAITLLAHRRSWRIGYAGCLATLVLCGASLESLHRPGRAPEIDASSHETVLLSGCVVSPPAFYEGRDQFVLELARKARARVSLTVREGEMPPDLRYGQPVELEARVRPIRNFQNPGAFDYQAY